MQKSLNTPANHAIHMIRNLSMALACLRSCYLVIYQEPKYC